MQTVAKGRKGTSSTFKGKGKLKGRTCVRLKLTKPHRTPRKGHIRGNPPAPFEFHGCFTSAKKARARAERVVGKKSQR